MRYSVFFFAMDATGVAQRFATESKELLERVEQRLREEDCFDEEEIQTGLTMATAICSGQLPRDCDPDYFDSLCWLAEIISEKVEIPSFIDFRSLGYLQEMQIWPWLRRSRPPFAVPTCTDPPPEVGFLSLQDIQQLALPGLDQLPPANDPEATYAREEFQGVLETLVEDKLDLLAVLL